MPAKPSLKGPFRPYKIWVVWSEPKLALAKLESTIHILPFIYIYIQGVLKVIDQKFFQISLLFHLTLSINFFLNYRWICRVFIYPSDFPYYSAKVSPLIAYTKMLLSPRCSESHLPKVFSYIFVISLNFINNFFLKL